MTNIVQVAPKYERTQVTYIWRIHQDNYSAVVKYLFFIEHVKLIRISLISLKVPNHDSRHGTNSNLP